MNLFLNTLVTMFYIFVSNLSLSLSLPHYYNFTKLCAMQYTAFLKYHLYFLKFKHGGSDKSLSKYFGMKRWYMIVSHSKYRLIIDTKLNIVK